MLRRIHLYVFIALELILYIVFNALDAAGIETVAIKYACVLICFAASCVSAALSRGEKDGVIVAVALGFTVVSDLFIFVLDDCYEVGLATFTVAQSLYFIRLYLGRKRWYISLAIRIIIAAAVALFACLYLGGGLLVAEACIYFVMLVANLVDSLILCRKGRRYILFAIGLILFVCCDICVGLFNFGRVLSVEIPPALYGFAKYGMWAFYVPSQALIVLSQKADFLGVKNERKAEENS